MNEYEFGEWRIWNGGPCPVPGDTMVQVQREFEDRITVERLMLIYHAHAFEWDWHDGAGVIAYRIATRKAPEVVRRYVHPNGWMITRGDYVGCKCLLIFEVDADGNPQNPRFEALE